MTGGQEKDPGIRRITTTLKRFALRRQASSVEPIPLSGDALHQLRLQDYQRLLETVEQSPTPIDTALNILFDQNSMISAEIEKRQITAGVEMFMGNNTERDVIVPPVLNSFTEEVLQGRKGTIDEITVQRSSNPNTNPRIYEPYILMEIKPDWSTSSPAEYEKGWVVDQDHETALGCTIHIAFREKGWEWSIVTQPVKSWIQNQGSIDLNKGEVEFDVIKAIASLIPVASLDREVRNPRKRIFMEPAVDL